MKRPPAPAVCGFCDRATDLVVSLETGAYRLRCLACEREVVIEREKWPGPAAAARSLRGGSQA